MREFFQATVVATLLFFPTPYASAQDVPAPGDLGSPECLAAQEFVIQEVGLESDFKNHGQYVRTAAHAANTQAISLECHSCIVSQFARSLPLPHEPCGEAGEPPEPPVISFCDPSEFGSFDFCWDRASSETDSCSNDDPTTVFDLCIVLANLQTSGVCVNTNDLGEGVANCEDLVECTPGENETFTCAQEGFFCGIDRLNCPNTPRCFPETAECTAQVPVP